MNAEKELARLAGGDLKIEQIEIDGFLINYAVAGKGPDLILIRLLANR